MLATIMIVVIADDSHWKITEEKTIKTRCYYRKETAASAFHISQHDNTARAHLNQ